MSLVQINAFQAMLQPLVAAQAPTAAVRTTVASAPVPALARTVPAVPELFFCDEPNHYVRFWHWLAAYISAGRVNTNNYGRRICYPDGAMPVPRGPRGVKSSVDQAFGGFLPKPVAPGLQMPVLRSLRDKIEFLESTAFDEGRIIVSAATIAEVVDEEAEGH